MNGRLILKTNGGLILGLALFMLVPLVVAWKNEEPEFYGFILTLTISLIAGLFMFKVVPKNFKLNIRSSILVVITSWISIEIFGALPYYFSGSLSAVDSVFESISGFTTTGASVFSDMESMGHGLLLWRSLTQWIGGMGIIVLSLAIFPSYGSSGAVMFKSEAPGPTHDKLGPRLKETARILWMVYITLTIILGILLYSFGMNSFEALCHALTTVSTGGFSTRNSSIAGFNNPNIEWIIIVFMLLGGLNFTLHFLAINRRSIWGYFKNLEFRVFISILGIMILCIYLQNNQFESMESTIRAIAFQATSIVTTTGFVSQDYALWGTFSKGIIFLGFFLGGCAGSTSGGIKIVRHIIFVKNALLQLKKLLHPRGVFYLKYSNESVKDKLVYHVFGFIILYLFLFLASSVILSCLGMDLKTATSAVATSLGNVGPGFGDIGPTNNFSQLDSLTKIVLAFCMVAGRLEIYTVVVIFTKKFWAS